METTKLKSFTSRVQSLLKTNKNFPQKLKQQLVLRSNNVKNPFQFIVELFTQGVLSDGSSDPEAYFGLKEMIVQLAIMIACSKGPDAIGSLMKALEGSGNSQLISALWTWMEEDFAVETQNDLSQPEDTAAAVEPLMSEQLPKNMKNANEVSSGAIKLIDKIMSRMEDDFMEQLEGHWIGLASKILNFPEFRSSLLRQNVIVEADMQMATGVAGQDKQWMQKAIQAACSKRAVGSLVVALHHSANEHIIQQTLEWLGTAPVKRNNYPVAVKSLANQRLKQESKAGTSTFLKQPAPSDGLQKVATFNCQPASCTKGQFVLELDKEQLRMRFPDSTTKVWSLQNHEEKIIKFDVRVKNITCSQFDDEILVLGTSAGTVHLFGLKTLEEKFSIRFSDPAHSLKFVESTLVVLTEGADRMNVWWVDISRPDMRLLNRRLVQAVNSRDTCGFYMDPDYSYLHSPGRIDILFTKTGSHVNNRRKKFCWLQPQSSMSTFNVLGLIKTKRHVVAGSKLGLIATWSKISTPGQHPCKILKQHTAGIVGLCAVNGHLLSLDQGGKLLMWSGYDLEGEDRMPLVARDLAANFFNVTSLVAHERWFASCSSKDGIINIWTLPDLWLRTG